MVAMQKEIEQVILTKRLPRVIINKMPSVKTKNRIIVKGQSMNIDIYYPFGIPVSPGIFMALFYWRKTVYATPFWGNTE